MALPVGKRDRYVTIRKKSQTQSVGEPVLANSTHAQWWARQRPLGGSEGQAGGQIAYANRRYIWEGSWVADVHEGMELVDDGVVHDIDFVDASGYRSNRLTLTTTQRDTATA